MSLRPTKSFRYKLATIGLRKLSAGNQEPDIAIRLELPSTKSKIRPVSLVLLQQCDYLAEAVHNGLPRSRERKICDTQLAKFIDTSDPLTGFEQRRAVRNSVGHGRAPVIP
jgi:hypothetical protein